MSHTRDNNDGPWILLILAVTLGCAIAISAFLRGAQ
jgi:hypothetical protein